MYRFNNIKQGILIVFLATLVTGCGGGGGGSATASAGTAGFYSSPETETAGSNFSPTNETVTSAPSTKSVQSGQVKDSTTGKGLANVKVSIGSKTTTTDVNGFYTLFDLTETEAAVVNFKKEGYLLGSSKIQIKELSKDNTPSTNYLEYSLYANEYQWNYDSTGKISGGSIIIDATYQDKEAKPYYNGTISAELTVLDVTTDEGKALFPGAFNGINTNGSLVQFYSYGLISISLRDSSGKSLSLADGQTGTLIFKNVSSQEDQTILPLWYYDLEQGLWFEEGYAELQTDGTYKGDISHLGVWSLNKPIETDAGIYRGRIINEDGTPASDVRINAIGKNWISSDLSTDEDGVFEIEVVPGKSFQLSAYNYKDKYKASYNNTISAIASGDIVED